LSSSFVAKAAHVAVTPVLGSVFLGQCKTQHALLNETYEDCTTMLNDAFTDLAHVRANLTLVEIERDNALVKVRNLTKANQAKEKEVKAAKKAGRRAVKKAKKEHDEAMIIKSEAHAKLLKTKDAELATLRAQLSSTHADLTQSEALVAHYKRTIDQLQAEGRVSNTLQCLRSTSGASSKLLTSSSLTTSRRAWKLPCCATTCGPPTTPPPRYVLSVVLMPVYSVSLFACLPTSFSLPLSLHTHTPQWSRFLLTILPIKQPQPVIDQLAQLRKDNGEQHKRRRAAEAQLADTRREAAMNLAQCRSNAEGTASAASEHAAALNTQLDTTKAALNHMTLLWEHTKQACQMKKESFITELSACQSSVDQGKEREKGLSNKIDELSSTEWNLNRKVATLEETVRQGTCGYQLKSGAQAIYKAVIGSPGQCGAWWVLSGLAKQQRKAQAARIKAKGKEAAEKRAEAARVTRQQKLEEERQKREEEAKKTFWLFRAVRSVW
jgi:hypothetical protein